MLEQCEQNEWAVYKEAPLVGVALYYESFCPFCRDYWTQELFPAYQKVGSIMNITLLPYGNTQVSSIRTSLNSEYVCYYFLKYFMTQFFRYTVTSFYKKKEMSRICLSSLMKNMPMVWCLSCFDDFFLYLQETYNKGNKTWSFECGHGAKECQEDIIHVSLTG